MATSMPITYTNRKGVTYTLYRGKTRTGKPRYYFGRADQNQGEPVTELPVSFTITESVNGVVSLIKDRPSLIKPEEGAIVEAELHKHPEGRRYRVAIKHNRIEVYKNIGPDLEALAEDLRASGLSLPGLAGDFTLLVLSQKRCSVLVTNYQTSAILFEQAGREASSILESSYGQNDPYCTR